MANLLPKNSYLYLTSITHIVVKPANISKTTTKHDVLPFIMRFAWWSNYYKAI